MAWKEKNKRLNQISIHEANSFFLKKKAHLFYIRDLGREALGDLRDNFLDQSLVLHRLSRFHDSKFSSPPSASR